MTMQPLRYSIVRLRPHIETEEFANVGVVLVAPYSGYLDFRLETKRISRITAFFDRLEPRLVRAFLNDCQSELVRLCALAGYDEAGQQRLDLQPRENAAALFAALTKDREGVIQYSDVHYALHAEPKTKLEELFEHYVSRTFIDVEYKERLLEKHVRSVIRSRARDRKFVSRTYSDGLYSARFPFVASAEDRDISALKPIFLAQGDPTRIFDHGNKWLFAVNRLRKQLPEKITFAVEGPASDDAGAAAFTEVRDSFTAADVEVVDVHSPELETAFLHLH